jgi:hypothetical protein
MRHPRKDIPWLPVAQALASAGHRATPGLDPPGGARCEMRRVGGRWQARIRHAPAGVPRAARRVVNRRTVPLFLDIDAIQADAPLVDLSAVRRSDPRPNPALTALLHALDARTA